MEKLKSFKGVTMIELLIVIIVISIALPGLMFYFFNWKSGLNEARLRSLATHLSYDLMEEVASKKWDHNRVVGPINDANKTLPASLGPESGESRYVSGSSVFDDIDDYHGLSENPPLDSQGTALSAFSFFTRSVVVEYVADTDLDLTVTSSPLPDYKKVSITVSWSGGTESVVLENIFSNR